MVTLIRGLGEIGGRFAQMLLNEGEYILGVKASLRSDDPKTARIKRLYEEHKDRCKIFLTDESASLEARMREALGSGLRCVKPEHCIVPARVDYILDATDGEVTARTVGDSKERFSHAPLLMQGGADPQLADSSFASVGYGCEQIAHVSRQLSCNATALATLYGRVAQADLLRHVTRATHRLHRRCRDPGEDKLWVPEPTPFERKDKYGIGITSVFPTLEGKLITYANKNPWERFHFGEAYIEFDRLSDDAYARIVSAFSSYRRAALAQDGIVSNSTESGICNGIDALTWMSRQMGIPDGDIMIPVYHLRRAGEHSLEVSFFVPQRSVVLYSCNDHRLVATGKCKTFEEASMITDASAFLYRNGEGLPLYPIRIKDRIERALGRWDR